MRDKNFFNHYQIIIFGTSMYSFYVPNGIEKNFQKKKETQEKIRITFFLIYHIINFW